MAGSNLRRFTHVHRHSLHEPWYRFIAGGSVVGAWLSSLATNAWDQGITTPTLGQAAQLPGSAPQTLHIAPQAPDPSATNATNGTPGSLEVDLAAPVNGGSEAKALFERGAQLFAAIGYYPAAGAGALWLGPPGFTPGVPALTVDSAGDLEFACGFANQYFMVNGTTLFQINPLGMSLGPSAPTYPYGGGSWALGIANSSAALTTTPVGGGFLYAIAGALHWLGSSGHDTLIAAADPYCPICGLDAVDEHRWTAGPNEGKYLSICFNCLAEHLGNPAFVLRDKSHREARKGWRSPLKATHKHYAFAAAAAAVAALISHFWR